MVWVFQHISVDGQATKGGRDMNESLFDDASGRFHQCSGCLFQVPTLGSTHGLQETQGSSGSIVVAVGLVLLIEFID